jgi:hypothetical protein
MPDDDTGDAEDVGQDERHQTNLSMELFRPDPGRKGLYSWQLRILSIHKDTKYP